MTLDALYYLVETYWIYLAIALAIGALTGWFSASAANANGANARKD